MDLANWALRTSPKFTTGIKYQFLQGFCPDRRSGNPNHPTEKKFEIEFPVNRPNRYKCHPFNSLRGRLEEQIYHHQSVLPKGRSSVLPGIE